MAGPSFITPSDCVDDIYEEVVGLDALPNSEKIPLLLEADCKVEEVEADEVEVDMSLFQLADIRLFSPVVNPIPSPTTSPLAWEPTSSVHSGSISPVPSTPTNDAESDDSCSEVGDGDTMVGESHLLPASSTVRLMVWAAKNAIRRKACNEILEIIRNFKETEAETLPRDFRTLFKGVLKPDIVQLEDGASLAYFGISNMLNHEGVFRRIRDKLSLVDPIKLTLHVDGLPLYKSSRNEFWPILGKVFDEIFILAIHCSVGKPASAHDYLSALVNEIEELYTNGIVIQGVQYRFQLRMLTADAPAKAFVLNCVGHNGYYSCGKCWIKGEYVNDHHVMSYVDVKARLRTNKEMRRREDEVHHKGESAFHGLSKFNWIRHITNDYMHSVCLGVWKALLHRWFKGLKRNQPCTSVVQEGINRHIKFISSNRYYPTLFARIPRTFDDLTHFKATEYRQFLLYLGPVIFNKQIHGFESELIRRMFCVFRTLCALTFKDSAEKRESELSFARDNIIWMIRNIARQYGNHVITYNWHSLLHLPDDCRRYGSVDNFSAFAFESFLQQVKNFVRGGNLPLPQVVNRYSEYVFSRQYDVGDCDRTMSDVPRVRASRPHDTYDFDDPSVSDHTRKIIMESDLYSWCEYKGMPLRTDRIGNSFCRLRSGYRMKILHFLRYKVTNLIYVQGILFENPKDLFEVPVPSSRVGAVTVSQRKTLMSGVISIDNIVCMCYPLPLDDSDTTKLVLIDILHSDLTSDIFY